MEEIKKIAKEVRSLAKGESRPDASQFRRLAKIIESGDIKKAWKCFRCMDTRNCDFINGDVWNFLYLNRTKGKKVISVKIKMGDKVILEGEIPFPVDADLNEIAGGIMHWEEEQRRDLLQFEYGDVKKRRS